MFVIVFLLMFQLPDVPLAVVVCNYETGALEVTKGGGRGSCCTPSIFDEFQLKEVPEEIHIVILEW